VQLAFATELFWSPTNKTVKVPADVAKKTIGGPADVDKLVLFDWAHVAKQRPQWAEKWNKEMRRSRGAERSQALEKDISF
jgi:putative spermidine/putrescine transport system substrate-binding protein